MTLRAIMGGDGDKRPAVQRPVLAARLEELPSLAENWTAGQIAEGRSRFFTATIAPTASIVCAW